MAVNIAERLAGKLAERMAEKVTGEKKPKKSGRFKFKREKTYQQSAENDAQANRDEQREQESQDRDKQLEAEQLLAIGAIFEVASKQNPTSGHDTVDAVAARSLMERLIGTKNVSDIAVGLQTVMEDIAGRKSHNDMSLAIRINAREQRDNLAYAVEDLADNPVSTLPLKRPESPPVDEDASPWKKFITKTGHISKVVATEATNFAANNAAAALSGMKTGEGLDYAVIKEKGGKAVLHLNQPSESFTGVDIGGDLLSGLIIAADPFGERPKWDVALGKINYFLPEKKKIEAPFGVIHFVDLDRDEKVASVPSIWPKKKAEALNAARSSLDPVDITAPDLKPEYNLHDALSGLFKGKKETVDKGDDESVEVEWKWR